MKEIAQMIGITLNTEQELKDLKYEAMKISNSDKRKAAIELDKFLSDYKQNKEIIDKLEMTNKKELTSKDEFIKMVKNKIDVPNKKMKYVNYYKNKREVDEYMRYSNEMDINVYGIDQYRNMIYAINNVIFDILSKEKQENGGVKGKIFKMTKKINIIKKYLEDDDFINLRKLIKCKGKNEIVRTKATEHMISLEYLVETRRKELEHNQENKWRVTWNSKLLRYRQRIKKIRNSNGNSEIPDREQTINFWNSIYSEVKWIDNSEKNIEEIINNTRINTTTLRLFNMNEIQNAIKGMPNWKALDGMKFKDFGLNTLQSYKKNC